MKFTFAKCSVKSCINNSIFWNMTRCRPWKIEGAVDENRSQAEPLGKIRMNLKKVVFLKRLRGWWHLPNLRILAKTEKPYLMWIWAKLRIWTEIPLEIENFLKTKILWKTENSKLWKCCFPKLRYPRNWDLSQNWDFFCKTENLKL